MNKKILVAITFSLVFFSGVITLFIGAYGGVLRPDNPFEFYSLVLFITLVSGRTGGICSR